MWYWSLLGVKRLTLSISAFLTGSLVAVLDSGRHHSHRRHPVQGRRVRVTSQRQEHGHQPSAPPDWSVCRTGHDVTVTSRLMTSSWRHYGHAHSSLCYWHVFPGPFHFGAYFVVLCRTSFIRVLRTFLRRLIIFFGIRHDARFYGQHEPSGWPDQTPSDCRQSEWRSANAWNGSCGLFSRSSIALINF